MSSAGGPRRRTQIRTQPSDCDVCGPAWGVLAQAVLQCRGATALHHQPAAADAVGDSARRPAVPCRVLLIDRFASARHLLRSKQMTDRPAQSLFRTPHTFAGPGLRAAAAGDMRGCSSRRRHDAAANTPDASSAPARDAGRSYVRPACTVAGGACAAAAGPRAIGSTAGGGVGAARPDAAPAPRYSPMSSAPPPGPRSAPHTAPATAPLAAPTATPSPAAKGPPNMPAAPPVAAPAATPRAVSFCSAAACFCAAAAGSGMTAGKPAAASGAARSASIALRNAAALHAAGRRAAALSRACNASQELGGCGTSSGHKPRERSCDRLHAHARLARKLPRP